MVFPVLFIEFYHRWGENEEYEYQRYASNTLNDFRHHSAPKNNNNKPDEVWKGIKIDTKQQQHCTNWEG